MAITFLIIIPNALFTQDISIGRIKTSVFDINRLYPYYLVDKEPQFPGGKDSLWNFINQISF